MKKLSLLLLLVVQSAGLFAQWNNTVTPNSDDYFKIQFTSPATGHVLRNQGTSATLLRTNTGGGSWIPCATITNHSIRDFHFINATAGFVVTDSGGVSSGKVHVFRTIDGGMNWVKISVIDSAQAYSPTIHFSGFTHGTVTETYGALWTTTNGGASWTKSTYNSEIFTDMEFPTPAIGYIGCWDGTFSYIGSVFKSVDSGATWNVVHTFPDINTAIDRLSFVDNNNGYASMVDYSLYKTNDGGLSWDSLLYFQQNSIDVLDMFFTSMSTGFAVDGYGNIFKTTDGAQTWQVDFPDDSVGVSLNYIVVSGNTGYASGYSGHVLKRDNVSGIGENEDILQARVFPNPTTGAFTVLFDKHELTQLNILNPNGQMVFTRSDFTGGKIDITQQPAGLYYVQIVRENGSKITQRVLITK